jgi:hypothetical protein
MLTALSETRNSHFMAECALPDSMPAHILDSCKRQRFAPSSKPPLDQLAFSSLADTCTNTMSVNFRGPKSALPSMWREADLFYSTTFSDLLTLHTARVSGHLFPQFSLQFEGLDLFDGILMQERNTLLS